MIFLRLLTLTLRDIILFSQGKHNRYDRSIPVVSCNERSCFDEKGCQTAITLKVAEITRFETCFPLYNDAREKPYKTPPEMLIFIRISGLVPINCAPLQSEVILIPDKYRLPNLNFIYQIYLYPFFIYSINVSTSSKSS